MTFGSRNKKQQQEIARKYRLHFLDAALYAEPSDVDGVHLGVEGHKALGAAIAEKIKEIFSLKSSEQE